MLLAEPVAMAVGVAPGEVVPAEIGVVAAVGEQVPAGDQDGVADGYGGLLLADPVGQPPELGRQVGVPGAGGGPGALGEDAGQPHVAVGGLARVALAAGNVVAWRHAGPRRQVSGGREPGHLDADLGEDALGGPIADSGNGVQPVTGLGERDAGLAGRGGEQGVDALVQFGDRALQMLDVLQRQPDQQRVVLAEPAAQRLTQRRGLGAKLPAGQLDQHLGVAFAGDQGGEHGPAGDAEDVGGDRVQLDARVLQRLLDPLGLGGVRLDQPLAIAGQTPQLANRRRGTKLLRSSPCSSSSASHSASSTSLLRPGRIFTWRLLTSRISSKGRSSSTYQTGFQYGPVASIAISLTPSARNQSAISSSVWVNEEKVRVCLRRLRPPGPGVRTQATTSSLPMSIPAHRSTSSSTSGLLPLVHDGTGPAGPTDQRRCEACTRTTVRGAGKAPGVNLITRLMGAMRERA